MYVTGIIIYELAELLLSDNEKKKWKYNRLANKYLQKFYQVADKRETVLRGFSMHVDNCPIKSRVWRGQPYANFIDDSSTFIRWAMYSFDR